MLATPGTRTRRDPTQTRGVVSGNAGSAGSSSSPRHDVASSEPGRSPSPAPRLAVDTTHPVPARRLRVVVAKPGLDGHDRGAKIIARALRDAGMEVIYTGLHQTPEQIVETVIQEDADAVGLSILSGAHMTLVPRIVQLLSEQGVDDVLVTVGGTIPNDDIPELKALGVAEVFTPGAPTQAITEFIRNEAGSAAALIRSRLPPRPQAPR